MNDSHQMQGRAAEAVHVFPGLGPDAVYSPDLPVPYRLTPEAEATLAAGPGHPGYEAAREAREAQAEWLDEWGGADSVAYQARVEAGLEPEAGP
jgi:hypothetical protein